MEKMTQNATHLRKARLLTKIGTMTTATSWEGKYGTRYFLLDYSACGRDISLHKELKALEASIESEFPINYRDSFSGMRELRCNV